MNTIVKVRILLIITHLLSFTVIFVNDIQWYYFFITFLSYIVIGKIGGEIGFHRLFAHKSFQTTFWKSRVLLILGSLNFVGSSLSWCGVHRVHHKTADTEKDPHSPYFNKLWKVWFIFWKPFIVNPRDVSDLIRDKWHMFIHKNYFLLCYTVMIIIGIIDYKFLIFGLIIPSIIQFHIGAFLIDIVCHKWGYRNYETKDQSRNNLFVNIITGGSGLHNNHHGKPGNPFFNHKEWEFDLPGLVIKHLLIKK
jgi:stearoyl-CoA desaturase (delta-9 desaturase)